MRTALRTVVLPRPDGRHDIYAATVDCVPVLERPGVWERAWIVLHRVLDLDGCLQRMAPDEPRPYEQVIAENDDEFQSEPDEQAFLDGLARQLAETHGARHHAERGLE